MVELMSQEFTRDHEAFLGQLCDVLHIPLKYCEPNKPLALTILSTLYNVPMEQDKAKRASAAYELVDAAYAGFEEIRLDSALANKFVDITNMGIDFPRAVENVANDMVVAVYLFDYLNTDTDSLLKELERLKTARWVLGFFAITGFGISSVKAGFAQALGEEGSIMHRANKGGKKAVERFLHGDEAVLEQLGKKAAAIRKAAPAITAISSVLYLVVKQRIAEIKDEILLRYETNTNGGVSDEQLSEALTEIDPTDIVKIDPSVVRQYWHDLR